MSLAKRWVVPLTVALCCLNNPLPRAIANTETETTTTNPAATAILPANILQPLSRSASAKPRLSAYQSGATIADLPEATVLSFDPRWVRIDLLKGWDQEDAAFKDRGALAFVSGPMYERVVDEQTNQEIGVALGDMKFGRSITWARNRAAARERAFVGVTQNGRVEFGYGALTPERKARYETFIGGLHAIYNDTQQVPPEYRGGYNSGIQQEFRYFLPRIRVVYGLRPDGQFSFFMSKDGMTMNEAITLSRRLGYLAAYMPDHASKSRLIIPGEKPFTPEDADWMSNGVLNYAHVPFLVRMTPRRAPVGFVRNQRLSIQARVRRNEFCQDLQGCDLSAMFSRIRDRLRDRTIIAVDQAVRYQLQPALDRFWAWTGGSSLQ
ncbi:hypothetical protein VZG28_05780 [Synechococcus elongatus IITB4]|uniref:hypothetical protein n=1 Tax=Synechococcus elongatus TaxID=32046 RepID=UPI0030CB46E0